MQKVTVAILLLFGLVLALSSWSGHVESKGKVNWVGLQEAEARAKKENKPVLIDLYTDWCGWCKVMDKQTYSHEKVAEYINTHFIPVKLDAETRNALQWKGKSYTYNASYKVNMYAVYLTEGQLSFPTTVIIPADDTRPQAIPGFLEPKDIESLLKYFGEGHYGKVPFQDYYKKFSGSWK